MTPPPASAVSESMTSPFFGPAVEVVTPTLMSVLSVAPAPRSVIVPLPVALLIMKIEASRAAPGGGVALVTLSGSSSVVPTRTLGNVTSLGVFTVP